MNNSELIVMLTHNDLTVSNAYEIFERCKDSDAKYWGFKENGLNLEDMKKLFAYMRECGKKTFLEVVAYTEKECLDGARMAVYCGCDYLMGTLYFDSVNKICNDFGIKYMPFVGKIYNRPSILDGTLEEMLIEAKEYLKNGVYGFDLLGYRYIKDPLLLIEGFVSRVNAPTCVAGSINSIQRLDEIKNINPWAFTIGSAFFEHKFGKDFNEQINKVYSYIHRP